VREEIALEIIHRYGGIDGGHHKQWVLDQVVRALTGAPVEDQEFMIMGTSDEYEEWVRLTKAGEDGPETYWWDVGIPP